MRRQQGKCDYSAKFCKGNYSSVAAGASTITPLSSSGISRHANVDTYAATHTCVHKIHTHASKQARTVAPALFPSVFHMHKSSPTSLPPPGKNTGSTITQRHRSAHDLATMQQAGGRSCSRRGNSVSVCSTEKREGKIGVRRVKL